LCYDIQEEKKMLILLRHGKSIWNKKNVFTGWVDIPLSEEGIKESFEAGKIIENIPIDLVFTSNLIRAQMTAFLALLRHKSGKLPVLQHEGKEGEWGGIYSDEIKKEMIPMFHAQALNERMYGSLQGLDKEKTAQKFGKEKVQLWRRSYDVEPPGGESLAMTIERAVPYFEQKILPFIQEKKNVLIVAHGNSLRGIVMFLEKLSHQEVVHLEIETGVPFFYDLKDGKWEKVHV
jgi:2,3-bisphosphoglycerate-dependent phosphoglycerate mutase